MLRYGTWAGRLGRGLQNLVERFDSARCLQFYLYLGGWWNGIHGGLKILCLYRLAGSSPAPPTRFYLKKMKWGSYPAQLNIVRI